MIGRLSGSKKRLVVSVQEVLARIAPADGAGAVGLEPLVHALGVELVRAGQHAQHLALLEVAHAHHARRLLVRSRAAARGVAGETR